MYTDFYGLAEKPFASTPDPRFLFLTEAHREALAQLVYGVTERKGFLVLTGEIGTGKTTLLHALLRRLDGRTAVAFVTSSLLPFEGILEYAMHEWGVPKPGDGQAQRLLALSAFLAERQRAGQNTVLILDEAQNLDVRTLEEVRLLSNLETATDKLLQILLVGQPELAARLERPELVQLRQRIALRCRLGRLARGETAEYVRTRLRVAGARDPELFTPRALRRIARASGGVPRVINALADHALLMGYADQRRPVGEDTVAAAVRYLAAGGRRRRDPLRVRGREPRWQRWLRGPGWSLGLAVGAAAALPALFLGPDAWRELAAPLAGLLQQVLGR